MKQPVKAPAKPDTASVRLLCILSGDGWSKNAGEIVELPADDAAQMVANKTAEYIKA
jgi:hypothetical protein